MLRNQARKYMEYELNYDEERELYHYNCAEVMLNAANDYYDLKLDERALKIMVPFGGGMYTEDVCGMLTGGAAVIGVMFAEDKPSKNLKMKEITRFWIEEFECEFKNTNCRLIKEINLNSNEGCGHLILKSADILEEIIKKYKN